MYKLYPITLEEMQVGEAVVQKEGLYYRFRCRCRLPSADIYVINCESGKGSVCLGVCVPDGNEFTLEKRISEKKVDTEQLKLYARPKSTAGVFSEGVTDGCHFLHLDKCRLSTLMTKQGMYCIQWSTKSNL